jgi:hypothetical protein
MPTRALHMRKIRELVRLKYEAHLSHEQIAGALAISKGVVANTWPASSARDSRARHCMECNEGAQERALNARCGRCKLAAEARPTTTRSIISCRHEFDH